MKTGKLTRSWTDKVREVDPEPAPKPGPPVPQPEPNNPLGILVLLAAVWLAVTVGPNLLKKLEPAPEPDGPKPPAVIDSQLSKEIRTALSDRPNGTNRSFAAFFEQCGRSLKSGAEPLPALRAMWEKAKALMELQGTPAMATIVGRELEAFDQGTGDPEFRKKYAEAFDRLASACWAAE